METKLTLSGMENLPLSFWVQIIQDAGHSANEVGTTAELVAANEKFKHLILNGGA